MCPVPLQLSFRSILTLLQWQHSLQEFDLAWCSIPEESLGEALKQLAARPEQSPLVALHLSGTAVEAASIKYGLQISSYSCAESLLISYSTAKTCR